MSEATMTSKGQVTVPADIRRTMGLQPQDLVTFTPLPNGTVLLRAKNKSFEDLRGLLTPAPGTRVDIADMSLGEA